MSTSIGAGNFADLYDVQIGTLADGHLPQWDATAGRWVNRTADAAGLVDKSSAQTITGAKKFASKVAVGPNDAIGGLHIQTGNAADILLYGRGAASQAGAYIDLRSSSNGAVFGVDNAGNVNVSASIFCPGIAIQGTSAALRNNYTFNWAVDSNPYSAKDVGLARNAAGQLRVTDGSTGNGRALASHFISTGNLWSLHDSSGLLMGSAQPINWSSSSAYTGGLDVGLARNAAGQLRVTNGSTGNGSLLAGGLSVPANTTTEVYGGGNANTATQSVLIGQTASIAAGGSPDQNVVIGFGASITSAARAVVIGQGASATASDAVVIGRGATAGNGGIAIGSGTNAGGAISIGRNNTINQTRAQVIGVNITTLSANETTLGVAGTGPHGNGIRVIGSSSTSTMRSLYTLSGEFADSTDATFKSRVISRVQDSGSTISGRETDRAETDGSRGYRILAAHATAPADSMLPNDSISFWQTGQAIQFKAKDSSGVIRGFGLRYIDGAISVSTLKGVMEVRTEAGSVYGYMPIYNTYGAA